MKLKTVKRTPILIAACVIGVTCLFQFFRLEFFEYLERITYDWRLRQAAKFSPVVATNLGFVDIHDGTIEAIKNGSLGFKFGLYWPRQIYGRVARELKTQGAKVTAFDVLFGELRPDLSQVPVLIQGQEQPVDSDVYFAQLISQAGNVLLAAEQDITPPKLFRTNALAIGDITAEKDPDGILRRASAFRTYRKWHRAFQQLEDDPDYGFDLRKAIFKPGQIILPRPEGDPVVFHLDSDGHFDLAEFVGTNIPPRMERHPKPFTEERVWHMGIVLAAQELKLDLDKAQVELDKGRIVLRGAGGVERTIPVDKDGYFYINWCLTDNDKHLTKDYFEHVLRQDRLHSTGATNGEPDEWMWKGKLAIIGSSTTGNDLTDRGATPLEKHALLVSKHWNVANSILTGRFIRRASLPVELAMTCVLGVIAALLTMTRRVIIAVSWVTAVFIMYAALALAALATYGYWLPMVLPLFGGLITTHGILLAHLVIFEQAEQRRVKAVFSKVVSPDVVTELLKTEKLSLTGARRNVTVLFADIRGFTEMTDFNRERAAAYVKEHGLTGEAAEAVFDRDAHETLDTVNKYLTAVAEVVRAHRGIIDKFIGDCVMAFWGAPITDHHHAIHCVRAAIAAQQAIFRINRKREAENRQRSEENLKRASTTEPLLEMLPILSMGSGINTGVVTVGLMGSEELSNYTVFGRDVNLASRLESASGRGRIIISESTLAEIIQDDSHLALSCVELPPEKVKGFREAVRIYEVPWRIGEFAPTGETMPQFSTSDTMQIYRPGSHDTNYVKGSDKPRG